MDWGFGGARGAASSSWRRRAQEPRGGLRVLLFSSARGSRRARRRGCGCGGLGEAEGRARGARACARGVAERARQGEASPTRAGGNRSPGVPARRGAPPGLLARRAKGNRVRILG